ncbi:MAG: DNA polymerase III subunit delta' [Butyrivibrio sp.]
MSLYDKILGHENIIKQLKTAVKNDKVSNAYIFNGEDGCGKAMIARAFAEALLCEMHSGEGCGQCHMCQQTASDNNPDIVWVKHEKPASIGVDDVREQLVDDIQIKPYNGGRKVYIIDEAEKMTTQAQNAILKTIEEPPEYGVIIFLTNNAQTFLPTIISRCVIFNLKPLRTDEIKTYLMREYKVPEYQAKICAAYSQGRLGKAINMATSDDFAEIRDEAVRLVKNIYTYDVPRLIDAVKKVSDYKITINDYIDIIEMWYRDVLLFKVTKDANNLVFTEELKAIRQQATKSSYEGIENILNGCEVAKARLKANVNFDLAMELMFLNIKEN